jgi:alpha-N-arabinofuranosidase
MTGIMEFAGIWKRHEQVYAVPAYYVFKMYTSVKGDTVLPVSSDSGTYNVNGGVRPLDKVQDIPYIDVVATQRLDGKTITLLCVNRALNQDVPTTFDLGKWHAAGAAQVLQISASNRYEMNNEVEPNHIVPAQGTIPVASSGSLSITLPHESVTVIRVQVR